MKAPTIYTQENATSFVRAAEVPEILLTRPYDGLPPIVLLDDFEDDAFFTRRVIRRTPFRNPVVWYDAGDNLIADFTALVAVPHEERISPHCFILDVRLPGCSGFDVLHWIRSEPDLASSFVIMLSGSDLEEDIAEAHARGADDYLVKIPTDSAMADALGRAGK